MDRTQSAALIGFSFHAVFAGYHLLFGAIEGSWWLLNLGSYYLVLAVVRFFVLFTKKCYRLATKITGMVLIILTVPLVGTVILSVLRDRGHKLPMIVMIAMAAYAFTRITLATVNLIKSRRHASWTIIALRNLSFADAFVSIFALQRSMLVSFEGMRKTEIVIMNALLGSAVCVTVFLLGLNLIVKSRQNGD